MKKSRIIIRALLIVSLILALAGVELIHSNYALTVGRYTVCSKGAGEGFRIVFLSDLHGREFGENNSQLIGKIAAEEPDVIALVGDIIDSNADGDELERTCGFISAAAQIAPVYFGMGNHEYRYMSSHDLPLAEMIEEAGAIVLDAEYVDVEINGTAVRIGGYEGYYRTPHMNSSDPARQSDDWRFFAEFEDTDRYKILLDHIPTNWLDWNYRDKYPVDLVLSGHYHGGVVRIPILEQGLYAPYVGYFPPYTKGCFEGRTATCILSTGMAGVRGIPRVFNPPEIVVVDVSPGK